MVSQGHKRPRSILSELDRLQESAKQTCSILDAIHAKERELLSLLSPLFPPGTNMIVEYGASYERKFVRIEHDPHDGFIISRLKYVDAWPNLPRKRRASP